MGGRQVKTRSRRIAIVAACAFAGGLFAASGAAAGVMDPEPGDMALGGAKAPVTVIEYASVGCPHCAEWRHDVFPTLKAKYIDTGRVRYVLREMLNGDPTIATAGFMLARCAGPAKYFQVIDAIYHRQAAMFQPGASAGPMLAEIAKAAGLSDAAFQACISDQKGLDALNARVQRHVDQDHVDSTPIFFVNGQRFEGEQTLDQLATAIRAARHVH
jgi:protein-disulfide isomerase